MSGPGCYRTTKQIQQIREHLYLKKKKLSAVQWSAEEIVALWSLAETQNKLERAMHMYRSVIHSLDERKKN